MNTKNLKNENLVQTEKRFWSWRHRKIFVASTLAWVTAVSWMFWVTSANNVSSKTLNIRPSTINFRPSVALESARTSINQKQKIWVKNIFHTNNPEIINSIETKNYEKFLTLTNSKIDINQFEKIVKKYNFHQSVKQSIAQNDYRSFQIASKWTSFETITQEEFENMVMKSLSRKSWL